MKRFLERFSDKFSKDDTSTLAASLAFYTALSLSPLLILFVTVAGQLSTQLEVHFVDQIRDLVGLEAAKTIEMVIVSARQRTDLSSLASFLGFLTLMVSASLIFGQLRTTLNKIFEVPNELGRDATWFQMIVAFLRQRLLHIGLALSFIFLLIVSLIASTVISATLRSQFLLPSLAANFVVSLSSYLMLFTLLFRFLPDRRLPWAHAAQGGALTAALFFVGKELIGIYLGNSAVGSSYGAAGSVIVLLVWVYYSALITFVGAQVSFLLHQRKSGKWSASPGSTS